MVGLSLFGAFMSVSGRHGRRAPVRRRRVAVLAAVGLVASAVVPLVAASPASAVPTLPSGFSRLAIATGIAPFDLVNFTFLPNGDLIAVGKCGSLRLVKESGSSTALAGGPSVYCTGDRGLLGIDVAADFATSRTVYTLYNRQSGTTIVSRLSRWTADSATAPTTLTGEVVILDDIPSFSSTGATCDDSHTIGTVAAAADGTLYVGSGDASSYCAVDASALGAQDLTSPRGKILRVTTTGSGVPTNPFYDAGAPTSWRSRVYASGLRNPYRFALQPATQAVYIGDVGWDTYEEINVASRGGENFGWPCYEGPDTFRNGYQTQAGCQTLYGQANAITSPLIYNRHTGSNGNAFVGGAFYTGTSYPLDYQGAFFYADYGLNQIWTVRTDAQHRIVRAPETTGFGSDIGAPVAMHAGPSGDIYYADVLSGTIYRLRYAPGNRAPVAQVVPSVTGGVAPLTVSFNGSTSYDLDGDPLTYAWTFGDGTTATGPTPSKTYAANGTYTATLTVTDTLGATGAASTTITVGNAPPTLTITGAPTGATYAVGDVVTLGVSASDPEDGALPDTAFSYASRIQHCPTVATLCHVHPGPLTGEQRLTGGWRLAIPDHGDASYSEVTVTATDSRGATATRTITFTPRYRKLTVTTVPAGIPVVVNSSDSNTLPTANEVENSVNTLIAPATFNDKAFVRWSNNGPRQQNLTMPAADVSLTATYTTVPKAVASVSPTNGPPPLTVQFSSAGSSDPDGDAITYLWDFGDGTATSTAANPSHVYATRGDWTATLTVTDSNGASATTTVAVTTNAVATGRVAAYAFDEGSGLTVADRSGQGNNGTLTNATWVAGRYGQALSFNGTSSIVTVPDSSTLDLTSGLTITAWVRPNATNTGWRTVAMKEAPGGLAYALYGSDDANRPQGLIKVGAADLGSRAGTEVTAGTWTHLAYTYDGTTMRTYVNGTESSATPQTGTIATSNGALSIGGNTIWGEWFNGAIDEVQVFNRALTAAEVAAARDTPILAQAPTDTTAPTTPGTPTATGGTSSVALSWTASTDNVAVTGYEVHRSTTTGFTPSTTTLVTTVTGTTYTDTGRAAGTYYYRIVARDAAGNTSTPSGQASAVVTGDITAPTSPGTPTATGAISSVALSWTASTDNVAVTGYEVHRSTTTGFTPSTTTLVTTVTGTTYTDTGRTAGTYYYRIVARDAAGNTSTPSGQASAVVTGDVTGPTVSVTSPVNGATVTVGSTVTLTATASDNVGVTAVRFSVDGTPIGADLTASPYTTTWSTTGVTVGQHTITAVARDAAGNSTTSATITVNVTAVSQTGLVAAYNFDQGTGTALPDRSGTGNNGTISNATWSTAGRTGGALSFNGTNASVSIPATASLNLTTGMTLEAWVRPTVATNWRTVLLKERPGGMAYSLYGGNTTGRPSQVINVGGVDRELPGTTALTVNTWTHLAVTYDGAVQRLYVNGTQVATRNQTGAIATSTGALKIGGNAVWSEWFNGLIDDVRIYNVARTAAQIVSDRDTPVA